MIIMIRIMITIMIVDTWYT